MSAAIYDVVQRTAKPNLGLLAVVETVDDKAVIAFVPMAPERYRIAHDDYAVIGPAAVINPMAAGTVAEVPLPPKPTPAASAKRNGQAIAQPARAEDPPFDGELPPPLPPPPQRRQPFGRFMKPFVNPDIIPDAPIREDRPPAPQQQQPMPEPVAAPVATQAPAPPKKKRKILDVEI